MIYISYVVAKVIVYMLADLQAMATMECVPSTCHLTKPLQLVLTQSTLVSSASTACCAATWPVQITYHNSSGSAVAALVGRLYYRQPVGVACGLQVVVCDRSVLEIRALIVRRCSMKPISYYSGSAGIDRQPAPDPLVYTR
jgi:hypothetical protein